MTISIILQTVIVLFLTAVSNGTAADAYSDNQSPDYVWSVDVSGLNIAGSGDNPWALPQTNNEMPQGPAYQVNPHYVTPEDIKSDSLKENVHRSRSHESGSTAPESSNRGRQQGYPYGLNYAPNYTMPGYGGYYGGFPGIDYGAPGFGGDPMLYPYGGDMDMGDPYNLRMQPYSTGSEGDNN